MKLIKHILFLSLVFGNSNVTAMEDDRLERREIVSNDYMALDKWRRKSNKNDYMSQLPINVMVKIAEYLPKETLFSLAFCSQYYLRLVKQSSSVSARFSNIVNEHDFTLLYRYVLLCPEIRCNIADVFKKITLVEVMLRDNDLLNSLKKIPEFSVLLGSRDMEIAFRFVQKNVLKPHSGRLYWCDFDFEDYRNTCQTEVITFLPPQLVGSQCIEINWSVGRLSYVPNVNTLRFLTTLYLPDNKFSNFSLRSFLAGLSNLNLSNLRVLNLSRNEITQLPPEVCGLSALERLNLCRNKLQYIDYIQDLANLKVLNLSHNKITQLPPDMSGLGRLEELNLACNKLQYIDAIQCLRSLKDLSLSHNEITQLPPDMSGFGRLEKLYLDHNKLQYIDGIQYFRSLRWLGLSYNLIKALPHMCALQSLEYFCLSHNPSDCLRIQGLVATCHVFGVSEENIDRI